MTPPLRNMVKQGDCLDVMEGISDNTFDMSFADPPFNLDKKYSKYQDDMLEKEYVDWCELWIKEMIRVTKGTIFIHNIPKWLTHHCNLLNQESYFRHWISWDAPTSPMGKSLQPAHYGILYYTKSNQDYKINELRMPHKRCRLCKKLWKDYGGKKHAIHPVGPLVSDVWTDIHRCKHDRYKDDHPCQLPVHLMERLVLLCTEEGDSVFDPFSGTGTTLIAAKRLGRKWFGAELDPKYADICRNKLGKETTHSNLNGIWVSCFRNTIYTVRDKDIWDSKNKEFSPVWIDLHQNWAGDDESRRELNSKPLKLKKEYQDVVKEVCANLSR